MIFLRRLVYSSLVIFLTFFDIAAQAPTTRTPRTNVDPNRQDATTRAWYEELRKRENTPTGIGSVRDTNETLIANLRSAALKKLKPSAEEEKNFGTFLKLPDTGLFKFAAETDCSKILDISNPDIECLNYYVEGKAKAYSFRKNRYSHEAYSDLERMNGNFITPGTYILGLLTSLGDVPIETINIQSEHVSALLKFAPPRELTEIINQDKSLAKGFMIGNLIYSKSVPIRENTTYLLRSVAYQAKFKNLPKSESRKGSLDDDNRSDVIVVFRVVRKDFDDTLLILWRELYRKEAPKLEVDMRK